MIQTTQTPSLESSTTPASPTTSSSSSSSSGSSVQRKSIARGKDFVTQMKSLTPRPVQRHGGGGENTAAVHEAAAAGTAGSGGSMPHQAAIQRSFGSHDVSGIKAHVGGAAKDASAAMGAEAYATGDRVAFSQAPSLHTAAHEAAHVVQQRAGVSLSGGVGQTGDRYERHADQVADAVVQGRSAEGILNHMTGGGAGGSVQRRVVQRVGPQQGPPQGQGQIPGTQGSVRVVPQLQATAPPEQFTGSKGVYDGNFTAVKGRMTANGATQANLQTFEGKKAQWYHDWGVAALQPTNGVAAAQAAFQGITRSLQGLFPDDSPSSGGGHLYTGRTSDPNNPGGGAETGRQRAESAMEQGNANPQNQQQGITHRTLETTCMGNLFDNVAQSKRDPVEQRQWIPWNDTIKDHWWGHISAEYANTFTGEVHAHVSIGFPYFVGKMVRDNPGLDRAAYMSKLNEVIKLDPTSVFGRDEINRIAPMMGAGTVTAFTVHLRCETTPGAFKNGNPSIPARGITTGDQLRAKVDEAIKALVSPTDLAPNLPAPPQNTGNAPQNSGTGN